MKKQQVLERLEEALRASKMELMCVRPTPEFLDILANKNFFNASDFTKAQMFSDAVREATELYRKSWIIGPLEEAIELIKGGK